MMTEYTQLLPQRIRHLSSAYRINFFSFFVEGFCRAQVMTLETPASNWLPDHSHTYIFCSILQFLKPKGEGGLHGTSTIWRTVLGASQATAQHPEASYLVYTFRQPQPGN